MPTVAEIHLLPETQGCMGEICAAAAAVFLLWPLGWLPEIAVNLAFIYSTA